MIYKELMLYIIRIAFQLKNQGLQPLRLYGNVKFAFSKPK